MNEEIESLHKNQIWVWAKFSMKKMIVGYKWVYKRKKGNPYVEDVKYKACLVAKGLEKGCELQ